jgi:hypothetical protein
MTKCLGTELGGEGYREGEGGGNWTDLTIFTPSFSPDEKDGGPDTERVVCRLPALSSPLMEPSGPTPPPPAPPLLAVAKTLPVFHEYPRARHKDHLLYFVFFNARLIYVDCL